MRSPKGSMTQKWLRSTPYLGEPVDCPYINVTEVDRYPKQMTHINKDRVGMNLRCEAGWDGHPLPILEETVSLARLSKKAETFLA